MQKIGIIWDRSRLSFGLCAPFAAATLGSIDGGIEYDSKYGERRDFETYEDARKWLEDEQCLRIDRGF